MWIRSQDKLILASRFEVIQIDEIKGKYCINNVHSNDGYDTLGEYSTKEKALKVLDVIQKCINNSNDKITMTKIAGYECGKRIDNYVTSNKINIVFEMPQDEEVE